MWACIFIFNPCWHNLYFWAQIYHCCKQQNMLLFTWLPDHLCCKFSPTDLVLKGWFSGVYKFKRKPNLERLGSGNKSSTNYSITSLVILLPPPPPPTQGDGGTSRITRIFKQSSTLCTVYVRKCLCFSYIIW